MPLQSFEKDEKTGAWKETWVAAPFDKDVCAVLTSDGHLQLKTVPPMPARALRIAKDGRFTVSSVLDEQGHAVFLPEALAEIGGGAVHDMPPENKVWEGVSIAVVEADQLIRLELSAEDQEEIRIMVAVTDLYAASLTG
jgi:hypothetical protein